MPVTWDPTDLREYSAFSPTNAMMVGPHSLLRRNGITFNNRAGLECFWVEDFSGFDSADIRISAQDNTEEIGELPERGFYGGRTMTLSGWVQAGSYPRLLTMGRELLDSLLGLEEVDMIITTQIGSIFTMADVSIACRPAAVNLATKIEGSDITKVFKRNFSISLRASDPTFKSTVLHTANLVPGVVNARGRAYPRGYDLGYTVLMDSAGNPVGAAANTITIHNDGNWDAWPILRFKGGMSGISLTNNATGHAMSLSGSIADGEYIELNTDPRDTYIVDNLGVDKSDRFIMSSDWLWLRGRRNGFSGDNVFALSVTTVSGAGGLDVRWKDTSL